MIRVSVNDDISAGSGLCARIPVASLSDLQALIDRDLPASGDILVAVRPDPEGQLPRAAEQFAAFMNFFLRAAGELSKELEAYNAGLAASDAQSHVAASQTEFVRMNAGGKCIRGALAKLGYHLFAGGTDSGYANGLALAFEIIQTSILIHDDIIDHATLRRNKTTIPYSYLSRWKAEERGLPGEEARDVADSLALCAGDLGIFLSFRMLLRAYKEDPRLPVLADYFITAMLNTIKGEIIDVALPFEEKHGLSREDSLYDSIIDISRLKTSWYTVTGPLCAGAIMAGCDGASLKTLEEFGENLGVAFQIKDDIMGIFSEEAPLGKNVGSDAAEFKQTLFYEYMRTREALYPKLLGYYGRKLTAQELAELQALLKDCGALDYVESEMNRYFQNAREILDRMDFLPEETKDLLYGLLIYLRYRKK